MGKTDKAEKGAKNPEKEAKKKARKEARKVEKEARKLEKARKEQKKAEKRAKEKARNLPQAVVSETPSWLDPLKKRAFVSEEDLKDSVFFKKRIEVSLSLLPAAMGNIKAALEDSVRSMILKYTRNVGILLSFHDLKVISDNGHGRILDELPHINYKVAFDGMVFCPKVGCKVQGVVSDSFPSHIGLLVLGYVNAMIPAQSLQEAGYAFDVDSFLWSQENGSHFFAKDEKVEFVVDKIHESMGTLSIEGSKPTQFVYPPTTLS